MSYFPPIASALITMLVIKLILSGQLRNKFQDIPNERSLHSIPIPRIGGIGLTMGLLVGWGLMLSSLVWWLVLPMVGLIAVSLLDDAKNLPVKSRFLSQLGAAALLVVGSGLLNNQGWLIAIIVLFLTVWMTNLYNFMDGSDGLAGGMALFGFSVYGVAAFLAHNETLAMLNFTIAAATIGFLYYNFPPARVFMGDAGSIPLGFLVATMGLWGWQQECWPMWFPLLVFSPFIVDASVTLLKRALRGAKITEAHREHYYQRAIQMGWGHRKLALVEYALMAAAGASALLCLEQNFSQLLLLIWAGVYAGIMAALDRSWWQFINRKQV
ncbi:MraY family glycosyltransferase [Sideroxydans sp.]